LVETAQAQVAANDLTEAVKTLKEASEANGAVSAKVMLDQAQLALSTKGPCRVTGLGHPRPYTWVTTSAGRPSIAFTARGAVVGWTDDHESPGHDHAYSELLDGSLRGASAPRDITPEATAAAGPELFVVGDRIGALYSDAKGSDAGLHVRWLDAEGRIAGPAVGITARKIGSSVARIDRATDGTFWVVWEDVGRQPDASDLFLRHLSSELAPVSAELRATEYALRPLKAKARTPSLGTSGGFLNIVFGFERGDQHAVHRLRIGSSDPVLEKGLEPAPPATAGREDRELGESTTVSLDKSKADLPQIDCGAEGCFLVWHEPLGVYAGYMDAARGQVLWRKKLDVRGTHPALAIAPSGAAVAAWFEGGKVKLAILGRDGVGAPTVVARANGDPLAPSLSSGGAPGEWFVTWLNSETGHVEPYAARVLCK
jgi:serine/threonine-protein kinase